MLCFISAIKSLSNKALDFIFSILKYPIFPLSADFINAALPGTVSAKLRLYVHSRKLLIIPEEGNSHRYFDESYTVAFEWGYRRLH
jgi:hypothetical protein